MSQFPMMVSACSLYMAFSWLCACTTRQAEISRLRRTLISRSKLGIVMLATSSSRQRTWIGSLPPYSSSALVQSRLKSCDTIIAVTKSKVGSVSLVMMNSAVFLSPKVSSSNSSLSISSRSSRMSKGANLAPQEMRIEERVLPADSRNFLYCLTAKCSGSFSSKRSNMRSTGL